VLGPFDVAVTVPPEMCSGPPSTPIAALAVGACPAIAVTVPPEILKIPTPFFKIPHDDKSAPETAPPRAPVVVTVPPEMIKSPAPSFIIPMLHPVLLVFAVEFIIPPEIFIVAFANAYIPALNASETSVFTFNSPPVMFMLLADNLTPTLAPTMDVPGLALKVPPWMYNAPAFIKNIPVLLPTIASDVEKPALIVPPFRVTLLLSHIIPATIVLERFFSNPPVIIPPFTSTFNENSIPAVLCVPLAREPSPIDFP
jgi:hypothetical protein